MRLLLARHRHWHRHWGSHCTPACLRFCLNNKAAKSMQQFFILRTVALSAYTCILCSAFYGGRYALWLLFYYYFSTFYFLHIVF